MSYDVSIGKFEANYTSNLAPFFHEHIGCGKNTGLQALHGLTGKLAHDQLASAFERIDRTRMELGESLMCEKYDARNKWGSVLGAIMLLSRLMVACAKHPDSTVDVSC